MTFPTIFANLPTGSSNLNIFDTMFNVVGGMGCIFCTASGANTITLTLNTNMPNVTAYANYQKFGFVAAADNTGAVTLNVNGIGALQAFGPGGTNQLSYPQVLTVGTYYEFIYNSALNSGAGGFEIVSANCALTPANDLSDVGSAANSLANINGAHIPATASGIGQWMGVVVTTGSSGSIALPAGGTWAYFAFNIGSALGTTQTWQSVAAGGTTIVAAAGTSAGTIENAGGFCWRIA